MAVNKRLQAKNHVFEESAATYLKTTEIHYTWAIHNFSLCPTTTGHALKSPTFPEGVKDDYSWQLILYPNGAAEQNKGSLTLKLIFLPGKKSGIEAKWTPNILQNNKIGYYGLTNVDLHKFNKATPQYYPNFIERSKVFDPALCLLPGNVLTILCDINIVENTTNTVNENNSKECKATACNQLHNDLSDLFLSPKFWDVTLITCSQKIHAHKAILAARSPVFAAMFNHETKEQKKNPVYVIDAAVVPYDVLREMLRYVYTGKITNLDKMAAGLLMAADKYGLKTLKDQCENALCKSITVENTARLLILGDLHNAGRLKKEALEFICTHTKDVMKTQSYQSLHQTHPRLIDETVETLANKNTVANASEVTARNSSMNRGEKRKYQDPELNKKI